MKAHTDINQSKKLAEILPIKSADMRFCFSHTLDGGITGHYPMIGREPSLGTIPCWSLSALMAQMPCVELQASNDGHCRAFWNNKYSEWHTNAVDACMELLERVRKEKEQ